MTMKATSVWKGLETFPTGSVCVWKILAGLLGAEWWEGGQHFSQMGQRTAHRAQHAGVGYKEEVGA